ncbi:uncharacterized protein N0V96_010832 [Colletotrichum fioriniae]|uniref:uncharacterized protein n=1 Tax=Colletotrichum fioriniae TaxID=710243 RepID=UPI0032DA96CB|nr:hypothetical protein N0V96_010832 [Colletotrichum fioriniae]
MHRKQEPSFGRNPQLPNDRRLQFSAQSHDKDQHERWAPTKSTVASGHDVASTTIKTTTNGPAENETPQIATATAADAAKTAATPTVTAIAARTDHHAKSDEDPDHATGGRRPAARAHQTLPRGNARAHETAIAAIATDTGGGDPLVTTTAAAGTKTPVAADTATAIEAQTPTQKIPPNPQSANGSRHPQAPSAAPGPSQNKTPLSPSPKAKNPKNQKRNPTSAQQASSRRPPTQSNKPMAPPSR